MHVFPTTEGLEIFLNENGTITLKQEDPSSGQDALVIIPVLHVTAVIKALRQIAKEAREA